MGCPLFSNMRLAINATLIYTKEGALVDLWMFSLIGIAHPLLDALYLSAQVQHLVSQA